VYFIMLRMMEMRKERIAVDGDEVMNFED